MSSTVVVTGASGYLGRHVVDAALAAGLRPIVVSRHPDEWLMQRLPESSIITSSVFDLDDAAWELIAGADALVHLAWRDGFVLRSRAHGEDLSAHYRFLMTAADRGVRRILPIGTMHEVGYWEGAVDANTPSRPTTPYGVAKAGLRSLLEASLADGDTALAWLRCYYILGDDARSNSIFNKILAAEERGDAEFPFTSGKNRYDFIAVEELASQIVTVAQSSDAAGVIECCSGTPTTLADAVERFISDHGLSIRLAYGAFPDRPFDSPGIWGDSTRIDAIMSAHATGREENR